MNVNPDDGRCRECGGVLEIINADDVTMLVACTDCCAIYHVEPDAFPGGCRTYYPQVLARKLREGGKHDAR